MKITYKEKGFTILELIAGIGVIAILAMIALPLIAGAINRAQDTVQVADVRNTAATIMTEAASQNMTSAQAGAYFTSGEGKTKIPSTVTVDPSDATVTGKTPLKTDKKLDPEAKKGSLAQIKFGDRLRFVE